MIKIAGLVGLALAAVHVSIASAQSLVAVKTQVEPTQSAVHRADDI